MIPAGSAASRQMMRSYWVHSTAGSYRVVARSTEAVRILALELEPTATVLRVEPEFDW